MTISATTRGLRPGVCTSTTRPGSPFDGMMIYETDTNLTRVWNGSAWKTLSYSDYTNGALLQVVQTVKTDSFTTTSTTFTDVTGMSASITPTSSTSTVLVVVQTGISPDASGTASSYITLLRGSTEVYRGDAAGSRVRASYGSNGTTARIDHVILPATLFYLDNPATTSSTTYKIQMRTSAGGTVALNRTALDTDSNQFPRTPSTITLMEIAG